MAPARKRRCDSSASNWAAEEAGRQANGRTNGRAASASSVGNISLLAPITVELKIQKTAQQLVFFAGIDERFDSFLFSYLLCQVGVAEEFACEQGWVRKLPPRREQEFENKRACSKMKAGLSGGVWHGVFYVLCYIAPKSTIT